MKEEIDKLQKLSATWKKNFAWTLVINKFKVKGENIIQTNDNLKVVMSILKSEIMNYKRLLKAEIGIIYWSSDKIHQKDNTNMWKEITGMKIYKAGYNRLEVKCQH